MAKYDKILLSDYELTEVYHDENLGINREGRTTVDFLGVWRCHEYTYKGKNNKETEGTRIIFVDGESIVVKEKYDLIEKLRREIKQEYITAQSIAIANGMD